MRQRIRLAQALAHDPRVLVLDEPLNGLDPLARSEMIALFRAAAAQGCYVIISSHILHEVDVISDQVILLSNGYVVAEGQIAKVRGEIQEHPTQILIRCTRPRELAAKMLEDAHTIEVKIHRDEKGVLLKTRDADWILSGAESAGHEWDRHRIDRAGGRRRSFRVRVFDRQRRGCSMTNPMTSGTVRLWWAQIKAVIRLEMKKTFFAKRGLWIYLVAALPVFLFIAFAVATSGRRRGEVGRLRGGSEKASDVPGSDGGEARHDARGSDGDPRQATGRFSLGRKSTTRTGRDCECASRRLPLL